MAFQVRLRINKNTIKVLSVATSTEEFQNTTIRDLKTKSFCLFPGINDPNRLWMIFGQNVLEDDRTLNFNSIQHLSLLVVVLRMPEGRGTPDPGGTKAHRKVNEAGLKGSFFKYLWTSKTVQNSDWLKVGSYVHERRSEIQANDYLSLSEAAGSLSITERSHWDSEPHEDERRRDPSDDVHMRERREGRAYQVPAEASAAQSDPDMQFLQSLLPALKRMDLRHREHTKLRIQQLVFEAEFNDSSSSGQRVRRTNSSERLRPDL